MSSLQQWTPTTLGELLIFTGGSQPPLSVFSKTEHEGYIRLIQIRDYKTDKYTTYIPKDLARRFCDADDIMIGRYGPPIFQILRGLEGAYNVALIKVTPKGNILKDFAWHYLRNDRLFKHIDKLSRRTSGQTGVDLNELENYPIQLPPLAEQQKIAQALTDADNYISALEKLIEKKKMMKEGLMVNLLTGKQRLKEFAFNGDGTAKDYKDSELGKIPEDWDLYKLEDISHILTGLPFSSIEFVESGIKLLRGSNVKRNSLDWSEDITVFWPSITADLSQYALKDKDIVISMDGSLVGKSFGQITSKDLPCLLVQRVARVRTFKGDQNLVKEWVCSNIFTEHCDSLKTVTAIPHISPQDIKSFKLALPSLLNEQKAISKTLKQMSQEISDLTLKREKALSIKQGMMQKLLTGEIRLA